jgi:HlyD family secretion protein
MSVAADQRPVAEQPSRADGDRPSVLSASARRGLLWAGAALVLLVPAFLLSGSFQQGGGLSDIPKAIVKRGNVRVTVTESGELQARSQSTVAAPNDKQIVSLVPEGTWVEEGDELVRFEKRKYEMAMEAKLTELAVAEADLEKALGSLEAQRKKQGAVHLEYKNLPSLAERGFVTQAEVAAGRLAYEETASRTRAFEADVTRARAGVEQARQGVAQAQQKLDQQTVRAPRAGYVVYAEIGEPGSGKKLQLGFIPFEGQPLMYLPDTSSMDVDLEISEVDLSKVRKGSAVEIRLDAYPDAAFQGEVIAISSLARPKISKVTSKPTGVKVFDVKVRVEGNDERLRLGLSATARILADDYPDALYIPLAAVFVDDLGETVVYVEGRRGAEARPVTIVDSNDRVAVVSEGLEEGQEILLGLPTP